MFDCSAPNVVQGHGKRACLGLFREVWPVGGYHDCGGVGGGGSTLAASKMHDGETS